MLAIVAYPGETLAILKSFVKPHLQ